MATTLDGTFDRKFCTGTYFFCIHPYFIVPRCTVVLEIDEFLTSYNVLFISRMKYSHAYFRWKKKGKNSCRILVRIFTIAVDRLIWISLKLCTLKSKLPIHWRFANYIPLVFNARNVLSYINRENSMPIHPFSYLCYYYMQGNN